jgi:hypothetical protein
LLAVDQEDRDDRNFQTPIQATDFKPSHGDKTNSPTDTFGPRTKLVVSDRLTTSISARMSVL